MSATRIDETDVLVVGGGPAGAATAMHLARHGVDVTVVDRASFPREKVCGDGLTPRGTKALLAMGVDPLGPGFVRIDGLRVHGGDGVRLEMPWPQVESFPSFGVVRTRHDLDDLLLARARAAGATVMEATEAVAPIVEQGWVRGATIHPAEADGEPARPLRSRYVVACDGAASRFAAQAGVRRDPARPIGVAARRYFRSRRPQDAMFESWLDLWDEDLLMPGYGWVFPVGDGILNVGAGLISTYRRFGRVSARGVYERFLRRLPPEWGIDEASAAGPLLSGPLPMGMNRRPLAMPGLLVAGDAGGLINPFNGEGIAYAMESGEIAAELVHDALATGRPGVAHVYALELRRRYGHYFSAGRVFVAAIGRPWVMRAATRLGLPRERLMRFLLRVMANLTDGRHGNAEDRVMDLLVRMVPER